MGDTVVTRSVLRGRVVRGTAVVDDGVVEVPGLCADVVALTDSWRVDRVMRGGAWVG